MISDPPIPNSPPSTACHKADDPGNNEVHTVSSLLPNLFQGGGECPVDAFREQHETDQFGGSLLAPEGLCVSPGQSGPLDRSGTDTRRCSTPERQYYDNHWQRPVPGNCDRPRQATPLRPACRRSRLVRRCGSRASPRVCLPRKSRRSPSDTAAGSGGRSSSMDGRSATSMDGSVDAPPRRPTGCWRRSQSHSTCWSVMSPWVNSRV